MVEWWFKVLNLACKLYFGLCSAEARFCHLDLRLRPEEKEEEEDEGGREDEEVEVLMEKEVFPLRVDGTTTRERFRGMTARGGGATRP